MFITNARVANLTQIENKVYLLKLFCPELAKKSSPGQFVNVRISENEFPLLRRPFSICDVDGDHFFLMFNILGEGTKSLARKREGDSVDLLGPLGCGFNYEDDFEVALLVAGGLGIAPFPFLTKMIGEQKEIITLIGGRGQHDILTHNLTNTLVATDDGSLGFHGNVVQLFINEFEKIKKRKIKVFACGPSAMLRALQKFCNENNINTELSTECAMACGFGICQGCPIESTKTPDHFLLVCKDGPVFNAKDVVF